VTVLCDKGVFLCECHGSVSQALPMDAICRFLAQMRPDLPVVVADDLCQPGVLRQLAQEHGIKPLVVGACSRLSPKLGFGAKPEEAAIDPFSIRVVNILGESMAFPDGNILMERVKLLLWAQVARQAKSSNVPEQALRMRFARPEGKISRRDLFETLMPRYQVIPYVQTEKCASGERCHLCQHVCALNAIAVDDNRVSIDRIRCQGCGACTTVCPCQAISYPTFSADQLHREMEGLLLAGGNLLEPRLLAFTCRPPSDETKTGLFRHTPNIMPLEVPCLNMVSCCLLLCAFDLGAQGIALVPDKGRCRIGLRLEGWQDKVRFVQELLQQWGIEPRRIQALEGSDSDIEQRLGQFARDIATLETTPLRSSQPLIVSTGGMALPSLILGLTEKLAPTGTRVVSGDCVPFGRLKIDISQCTGCGLCSLDCPTGALSLVSDTRSCQLLFRHQACVGCGQCVTVCPESCLHLKKILELERLDKPAEVIFASEIARCHRCGAPIAPRAMIDKLRARIAAAQGTTTQLDICPACRTKSVSGAAASMIGV